MRLTVVGDALLDRDVHGRSTRRTPDHDVPVLEDLASHARPGGAALAALLAARDGAEVTLVAPLAADAGGRRMRALLREAGVAIAALELPGRTPEKVRVFGAGEPVARVDHHCGGVAPPGALTREAREAIAAADAVLVSDYGRGTTARLDVRSALLGRRVVWDPHPKGTEPVAGAALVTPNEAEARTQVGDDRDPAALATALAEAWGADAVAVTCGAAGAHVAEDGGQHHVPAEPAEGDPCGAGDRFAAAAAVAVARGASAADAVREAVAAASAFVAAGGAATVCAPPRREGTLVATGGCFDLLHAGHVALLQAAAALGDRLVVLLNSDDSVRRLKGPSRPVVPEQDRAAVLKAIAGVDDVVIFEEDDPTAALARLKPDVWVKAEDYAGVELPEAATVEAGGGRVALVPLAPGRSTTRLIKEATSRA